jgi:L-seryl-tRNA(Ser) seleniumtransferase
VSGADPQRAELRALPSVDRLAAAIAAGDEAIAPGEAVAAARATLARRRAELVDGGRPVVAERDLVARGRAWLRPSLRRVLNGTGVVVHTNLGRAPLADAAAAAVADAARGCANVELDLASGRRGSRHDHVAALLRELTGAEDGFAVNNGAGAALLALAGVGGALGPPAFAVSRGQLVEIGGGFRVPDVLAQAGAALVEVGTTNRTRLADYERALAPAAEGGGGANAVLRVHPSNFRTVGFVEEVAIEPLCALGVPVVDDLGSGALASGLPALADEPPVVRSVAAGAAVVCFSGDKLLGGPQAGLLVGRAWAVDACRRHPLARALRIGRLPLAALAATLRLYRDPARARRELPVLAMLDAAPATLRARADRVTAAVRDALPAAAVDGRLTTAEAVARVGGGALPLLELPGPALALGAADDDPAALAAALRAADPPLLARIADGRVLVDPRTLADDELAPAAAAIAAALRATAAQ